MVERLQKKAPFIVAALVIALLSWLVVSGFASSTDFHKSTLAELEEKQTTVLELSAASAAAIAAFLSFSAAISASFRLCSSLCSSRLSSSLIPFGNTVRQYTSLSAYLICTSSFICKAFIDASISLCVSAPSNASLTSLLGTTTYSPADRYFITASNTLIIFSLSILYSRPAAFFRLPFLQFYFFVYFPYFF